MPRKKRDPGEGIVIVRANEPSARAVNEARRILYEAYIGPFPNIIIASKGGE